MIEIDVAEANRLVDAGQAVLLDVREPQEWEGGHAPKAQLVPLGLLDPSAFAGVGPVVVVCRMGGRSAEATRQLVAAGVDATNVAGGMTAWEIAGLPVVRDDGSPGLVL